MKIAWFTPFSCKSAIGMVSRDICEKLSEKDEVDIWTHDTSDLISTKLKVIFFSTDDDLSVLREYDHIIYNMGNFAGNHRDIYDVSQLYSGIVILHDQTMSGFWGQYYTFPEFGGDAAAGFSPYIELFRSSYGQAAAEYAVTAYKSGHYPVYTYGDMEKFHLIEPTIRNAKGVFTHASFFCREIKKYYNGPVGYTYLPCKHRELTECDHEIFEVIRQAKANGKKIIVSNGIVHPVKQIDKVTDVLMNDPGLAERIVYIVIGGYGGDYFDKLAGLAENELKGCLYMLGYQPYELMDNVLENADMCVNLRYPNSEVCSLSLLEQMSVGKPVLVINSGIYGEMPDDCVVKIQHDELYKGIYRVLSNLINNKDPYAETGENAKKFIEDNCTVEIYCEKLLDFINNIAVYRKISDFQQDFIQDMTHKMGFLGISGSNSYSIINAVGDIFNDVKSDDRRVKTIGVWAAFPYAVPNLNREGISRFMSFMISEISKRYELNVEVWCYSFNEEEIKKIFSGMESERLVIVTEKNWDQLFSPRFDIIDAVGDINENLDNLNEAAYYVSKADIMLPMIVYLDSVVGTGKRIFVPAHDMAVAAHYEEFVVKDRYYKSRHMDITARAENLARNGAVFFSNCNTVRENQVLKYVRNLKKENTATVYLPVNIPEGIEDNIISESEIRRKFGIEGRYLFYPTQVRPYKNVSLLAKAFADLAEKYSDLTLVLTGNTNDVPEVAQIIREKGIESRIMSLGSVSEYELYSIYKYAAAVPVPSLFEGGFPWQACEALFMNAPLAVSYIDVVRERIEALGFTAESSGLCLFDPYDAEELSCKLSALIENREKAVSNQAAFAEKLLSYSWSDAADKYYALFTR